MNPLESVKIPPKKDRYDTIEKLKMYFCTFFLECFDLVQLPDMKELVEAGLLRTKVMCATNHSSFCMLARLLELVQMRKRDLMRLCKNDFLGSFKGLEKRLFRDSSTIDRKTTAVETFFKKFFNSDYTTSSMNEHNEIIDWCLTVVQFEEATPERVNLALDRLDDLRRYLLHRAMDEQNFQALQMHDILNVEKFHTNLAAAMDKGPQAASSLKNLGPEDTKRCDCDEYEASGDCNCVEDML